MTVEEKNFLRARCLLGSICIFILDIFVPYFSADPRLFNVLIIFSFGLFVISLLLGRYIDLRLLIVIILITIFDYFIYETQWTEHMSMANKMLKLFEFWFPLMITGYLFSGEEKLNYKQKNFIIHLFIIIYTITSITTILGNIHYNIPSRYLATSTLEADLATLYRTENIGGFGFCYMAIFVVPLLIYMWKKNRNNLYVIPLIITYISCIESEYTILIFLVVLITFFTFFDNLSTRKKFFTGMFVIVALLGALLNLKTIMLWLINFFEGQESVVRRLYEIYERLSGTVSSVSDLALRREVYEKSWDAFLSNPLIGNYKMELGGHSEILDLAGSMGIIGILLLLFIIILTYSLISKYMKNINKFGRYHLKLNSVFLFFLACLNPIFASIELGFVVLIVMLYVTTYQKIYFSIK